MGAPFIYLKILVRSLSSDCRMKFQHYGDSLEEEIADDIDENDVSLIALTVEFLKKHELMIEEDDGTFFFPQAAEMSGKEGGSAQRMRDKRNRDKNLKTSQCDDDPSLCDGDESQSDSDASLCSVVKDKVKVKEENSYNKAIFTSLLLQENDAAAPAAPVPDAGGGASPFSFTEVEQCAKEYEIDLTTRQLHNFYDWMEKYDWKINGRKVSKLENALRGYEKKHQKQKTKKEEKATDKTPTTELPISKSLEEQCLEISRNAVPPELWSRYPDGRHVLTELFAQKSLFNEEQFAYMREKWGVLVRETPEGRHSKKFKRMFVPIDHELEMTIVDVVERNIWKSIKKEFPAFQEDNETGRTIRNTLLKAFVKRDELTIKEQAYLQEKYDIELSNEPQFENDEGYSKMVQTKKENPNFHW